MSNDSSKLSSRSNLTLEASSSASQITPGTPPKTEVPQQTPEQVIVAIGAYLLFHNRESLGLYGALHYGK